MPEALTGPTFGSGLRQLAMVMDLLRHAAAGDVEAIAPLLHPDMSMLAAPGLAPARPYTTREDFLEYFTEARENGVRIQPDVREIRLCPAGVIATGSVRMTSGAGVDETPAWFVYTLRDGLIASLATHLSAELAESAAQKA